MQQQIWFFVKNMHFALIIFFQLYICFPMNSFCNKHERTIKKQLICILCYFKSFEFTALCEKRLIWILTHRQEHLFVYIISKASWTCFTPNKAKKTDTNSFSPKRTKKKTPKMHYVLKNKKHWNHTWQHNISHILIRTCTNLLFRELSKNSIFSSNETGTRQAQEPVI